MYERLECLAKEVTDALTETQLDNKAADWSKNEVNWALRNGILKGDERGDLMLHSPVTWEQLCVMLERYHDKRQLPQDNQTSQINE